MKQLFIMTTMLICSLFLGISADVFAACTVWHTECVYDCIQYYPNGTDCWKSKKRCFNVCDDFDVHISGPTAKTKTSTGFRFTNSRQELDEGNMSVRGQLARIVSFRLDAPIWLLTLETPLVYGKEQINHLEVHALEAPDEGLIGKQVTISGAIEWRDGRLGGKQPILIAKDFVAFPTEMKKSAPKAETKQPARK